VYLLTHPQLHQLPDGGHTTSQHSNVLPCPAPRRLPSYSLAHQWNKTPAHAWEQTLAQGCLHGKWDKPSRRSWLASDDITQIRKRPGETRLEEPLHDQDYITRLYIQPPHTSRWGKGCVCTHMHTVSRHLLLSPALAGSAGYKGACCALHGRSLT